MLFKRLLYYWLVGWLVCQLFYTIIIIIGIREVRMYVCVCVWYGCRVIILLGCESINRDESVSQRFGRILFVLNYVRFIERAA